MSEHEIFAVVRRDSVETFVDKLKTVDPTVTTSDGRSMLHVAIAFRRTQHAERLILGGVNVNAKDKDGQTPLHYAAIHGLLEIVRLLVDHNGDQSICDKYGNTPLWYATFNARGHYDLVRLCVQAGGVADHQNKSGRSPTDFAKQIGDIKLQGVLAAR